MSGRAASCAGLCLLGRPNDEQLHLCDSTTVHFDSSMVTWIHLLNPQI
jgi:hypothetical protein